MNMRSAPARKEVIARAEAAEAEVERQNEWINLLCSELEAFHAGLAQDARVRAAEAKVARVEALIDDLVGPYKDAGSRITSSLRLSVGQLRAALDGRLHGEGCIDCDNGATGFHRSRTDQPNGLRPT